MANRIAINVLIEVRQFVHHFRRTGSGVGAGAVMFISGVMDHAGLIKDIIRYRSHSNFSELSSLNELWGTERCGANAATQWV